MTLQHFTKLISSVSAHIHGKSLDSALEAELNKTFPLKGEALHTIFAACQSAIEAGWMCNREAGGIKYGRVIKPCDELHGFSVDVVQMTDLAGPHHRHPNGEIDLIMPLTIGATFDGHPGGWLVYGPGTAHYPTVANGSALVLYLLPHGAIEFTK